MTVSRRPDSAPRSNKQTRTAQATWMQRRILTAVEKTEKLRPSSLAMLTRAWCELEEAKRRIRADAKAQHPKPQANATPATPRFAEHADAG